MHRQAGDQVGQHGGTNRGLGGGEGGEGSHLDGDHPHGGGGMSQGKRDTWGSFAQRGVPWLYLLTGLNHLAVKRWPKIKKIKGFKASIFSVLSTKRFLSGADRKGEGFTAGGVVL